MENNNVYTIEMLDEMEGHDFEYACAELLRHTGWRNIEVTQGAGDYGIDILARKGTTKYAIQCKRWKNNVGVKALQEVGLGCEYYHCDMAAVMTNSNFTKQAENLAKKTGVRLWGRNHLIKLIDDWDEEYDTISPQIIVKKAISNDVFRKDVLYFVYESNPLYCLYTAIHHIIYYIYYFLVLCIKLI